MIERGISLYTRRWENASFAERFESQAEVELNGGVVAGSVASFPEIINVKSVIAKLKAVDTGSNTVKINSGQTITITAGNLFGSYTNATAFDADDIQVDDWEKFELVEMFPHELTAAELTAYQNGTMWSYDQNCELALPMLLRDHDATNSQTLDRSGNNNHAVFGTNAPAKLTNAAGYEFDQANTEYMTLTNAITLSNADDWGFHFIWKASGAGTDRVLFGSSTGTSSYVFRISANSVWIYDGVSVVQTVLSSDFIDEDRYFINVNYNKTTKLWSITRTNLSGGGDTETVVGDLSSITSISVNIFGKRGSNDRYLDGEVENLFIYSSNLNPTQIRDLYQRMLTNEIEGGQGR